MRSTVFALPVALALAACSGEVPPEAGPELPPLVPAEQLLARVHEGTAAPIADARPRGQFLAAHPEGAIPAPVEEFDPGALALEDPRQVGDLLRSLREAGLPPAGEVVLLDEGSLEGFERAAYACWLLSLGGARCHIVEGGVQAWQAAGGAVVEERTATPPPGAAPTPADPASAAPILATLDDLRAATAGDPIALVDVRCGEVAERIPGAFRLPLDTVVDRSGAVLADRLQRQIERLGLTVPERLIVLGDGPANGAAGWFLLHRVAGLPEVSLFPGGMPRWRRYPTLPLVAAAGQEAEPGPDASAPPPAPAEAGPAR